jgi:hypothetical protein
MDRAALTVYEFTKCCEDAAFVDRIRRIIRKMADRPPPHPFEQGALGAQDGMLPQYDFSLRYKPFTKGQVYSGSQMNQPLAHLTNPREFWPRFVVPATSLADPRTNPRGYTDGGILLDVNNWFPFQGLLRMGYRDVAVELFWRTVDLMSAHGILSWGCCNFMADDGTPFSDRLTADAGVGVDMILRCGTGFLPRTDDLFEFDPLILGPKLERLDWGPYRYKKYWIEVHWRAAGGDSQYPAGFTVLVGGARFHVAQPGHILLRLDNGRLQPVPLIPDPLDISAEH